MIAVRTGSVRLVDQVDTSVGCLDKLNVHGQHFFEILVRLANLPKLAELEVPCAAWIAKLSIIPRARPDCKFAGLLSRRFRVAA